MSLDQLDRVIDGLEASRRMLDSIELGVLGEWDRRSGHDRSGAVSGAAALAHRHGRDRRRLRRDLTAARKLRQLPVMAAALADGSVTYDHADALTRVLTDRTAGAMDRDEAMLVEVAQRLGVDGYRKALRHWKAHADPDGTDPDDDLPSEWTVSRSLEGAVFTKGRFTTEAGATIGRAVDALADELRRAAGPDADPTPVAQRRAEALVELCRRGACIGSDGEPARRARPQVVVTIDHRNLVDQVGLGELDRGETIGVAAVRRLACDADVIAAVFGTDAALLDLGRRARLVSPAQRLALVMRDGGCAFPGCDRPPDWCDAHHIDHWVDGGPSDLDNLCLLCSTHHHRLHEGGWTVHRGGTGSLVFTDPGGLTLPDAARPPGHPDPWLDAPPGSRPPAPGRLPPPSTPGSGW